MVLTGARITALVHGNMTAASAAKLVRGMAQQCFGGSVVPALPYYVAIRPQQRIVALPAGQSTIRQMRGCDEENVNSAIVCVYQTPGVSDARSAAVEDLLGAIVGDAFFTQLRTQEQLGYIVFFSVQRDDAESCFRCIVQSDAASPVLLNWRIERYLQRQCLAMLRDMPAAEFAKYREALVVEREQPEKRLSELSQRIWREVDSGSLNFRRKEVSVELIRSIEQAELVQYFATHVANVDTRRKFAVEVFSQAHYDASLRAHTGERPLLRVTARAGSKDLDDARADGLPIDGDSIDTQHSKASALSPLAPIGTRSSCARCSVRSTLAICRTRVIRRRPRRKQRRPKHSKTFENHFSAKKSKYRQSERENPKKNKTH
jgi:secreted Zn-dependent insulinase-like peptidase